MKSFSRFLTEARASKATEQARRLGLKGDGHGGWYDQTGEFVAKTVGGELKFYNQNDRPGQDPPQARTQRNQQVAATQIAPEPVAPIAQQEVPPEEQEPEEPQKILTVTFGRFNPPTIGHEKLLKMAQKIAAGGDLRIFPSRTHDPKKNPLDPGTKISYMKKMFPQFAESIVDSDKMKSIFDVLVVSNEEYHAVNIVVGADRQAEFENLANKYNGQLYEYEQIRVVSAGARDADAEGIEGMSASKMRKAAAEGDYDTFKRGIPSSLGEKDTKSLYNTLRKSMGDVKSSKKKTTKEGFQLWEIAPKCDYENLRENYITKKIFKVGEEVENLNTGLVGMIKRRGPNYLICVSENNVMFKSWIKDVMETKDIEVPSNNLKKLIKKAVRRVDNNIDGFVDKDDPKVGPYGAFIPQVKNTPRLLRKEWTDVSGVPANQREVGTDALRKYIMRMTGTTDIKNFINKYKVKGK
jgi:phosphopantetheine adenylyltransferase